MTIYAVYIVVLVVTLLINLNGFLQGAKKAQIDIALRILVFGILLATFAVWNWKYGIIAVCIAFLSFRLTRSIAAHIASKLLSTTKGEHDSYIGLPSKALERISKHLDMGLLTDPDQIDKIVDRAHAAEEALLDFCESRSAIRAVMEESHVSRDDLKEIYFQLIDTGAGQWICGHWVPASALAYPESLKYILSRRDKDISDTSFNLIMYFEHGTFGIKINGHLVDSSSGRQ